MSRSLTPDRANFQADSRPGRHRSGDRTTACVAGSVQACPAARLMLVLYLGSR
jgi:hypothetical protein